PPPPASLPPDPRGGEEVKARAGRVERCPGRLEADGFELLLARDLDEHLEERRPVGGIVFAFRQAVHSLPDGNEPRTKGGIRSRRETPIPIVARDLVPLHDAA